MDNEGDEMIDQPKDDGWYIQSKVSKRNIIIAGVMFVLILAAIITTVAVLKAGGVDEVMGAIDEYMNESCDMIRTSSGCKQCAGHIPNCQTCSETELPEGQSILDDSGRDTGRYLACGTCEGDTYFVNGECGGLGFSFCS